MNRRYERPEVKQVTKQWVKENCKNVTDRDLGLLRTLYDSKRRLLRRDQIEVLYPEFASTDRLNKRIKALFKMHILDRVYPSVGIGEGSSQQYVCLDRAGVILLEIDRYNKPIIQDSSGNRSLPLGWQHKVTLNDYECRIISLMREMGGEVLMYEVEEPYYYGDSKIIPDILCLIRYNGKGYLFFIEADLGTEDLPYVKAKIDAYTDFYLSRSWLSSSWAKVFKTPTFPRILLLTEEGRPKRKNALEDYTRESGLRFLFGFHSELESIIKGLT